MEKSNRTEFYLTTPIYYVNDKPHLGHAYTTIAADVLARFHRLRGLDVFFLTGTDEHGTKIEKKAAELKKTPKELADENSAHFEMLFDRLNISNDDFIRTTAERHHKAVDKFMNLLQAKGVFYEDEYSGLYCAGCEKFVTEKELIEGKCPDHKKVPERISEKNYFFKLREYLPKVKELIARNELVIEPARIRSEILALLENEVLDDFSVSREKVKWGIPLSFAPKQTVYVWVEALENYLSAVGYENDEAKFKKYWPADLHLMAKEIIKFHAIYWPALLLAADLPLPKKIFAHGFFTIDGEKMSKSLKNVIDPNKLIDSFGADATRYLLLSQFPFGKDGDIKFDKFVEQYNADLAHGISNFFHRVISMTEKYFGGVVPNSEADHPVRTGRDLSVRESIDKFWRDYARNLENLKIDQALNQIINLARKGDGIIEKNKPWEMAKTDQNLLSGIIYDLLELNRHIALAIYPFMPETAEKMLTTLGVAKEKNQKLDEIIKWGKLESGAKIKKSEPLFMRK